MGGGRVDPDGWAGLDVWVARCDQGRKAGGCATRAVQWRVSQATAPPWAYKRSAKARAPRLAPGCQHGAAPHARDALVAGRAWRGSSQRVVRQPCLLKGWEEVQLVHRGPAVQAAPAQQQAAQRGEACGGRRQLRQRTCCCPGRRGGGGGGRGGAGATSRMAPHRLSYWPPILDAASSLSVPLQHSWPLPCGPHLPYTPQQPVGCR